MEERDHFASASNQKLVQSSATGAQVFNPNFIQQRVRRMTENRQDVSYNFVGKAQGKEGFDITRLVSPPFDQINEDFLCGICQKIVNVPVECDNVDCGQLYCSHCLNMKMYDKNLQQDQKECEVCKRVNGGYRAPSALVLKMMSAYQVTCFTCSKPFNLNNLASHEIMCQQSVCSNELCGLSLTDNPQQQLLIDFEDDCVSVEQVIARNMEQQSTKIKFSIMGEDFVSCSKKCKKVTKFAYMLRQNNEQEILRAFETMLRKKVKKQQMVTQPFLKNELSSVNQGGNRTSTERQTLQFDQYSHNSARYNTLSTQKKLGLSNYNKGEEEEEFKQGKEAAAYTSRFSLKMLNFCPDIHEFSWDPDNSSKEITFSSDYRHAFLFETNYLFRTMISNRPFMDGQHYWEIIADARTEHELKIGVTTQQKFSVSNAFCDYEFGFGFYGFGQLRHGSNADGKKFGKPFKKKGILGVFLDMDQGQISFALDGEYFGVAFQSETLKRGPIWAAISLLHTGGCTLISGLSKPSYFV